MLGVPHALGCARRTDRQRKVCWRKLETSVDYLLTGTGNDSTLANARLFRRFQALEHLGEEDQSTVIRVIDAMLAQQRVASAMAPVD